MCFRDLSRWFAVWVSSFVSDYPPIKKVIFLSHIHQMRNFRESHTDKLLLIVGSYNIFHLNFTSRRANTLITFKYSFWFRVNISYYMIRRPNVIVVKSANVVQNAKSR